MKRMLLIFAVLGFFGCTQDYRFDRDVTPQIVINSILCPDSTIRVDLWYSRKIDGTATFDRLENARAVMYEDDRQLFDLQSQDGAVRWNYRPVQGKTYRITVDAEGMKQASAVTVVPQKPQAQCQFIKFVTKYYYYTVNDVVAGDHTSCIMIAALCQLDPETVDMSKLTDKNYRTQYRQINTMAQFTDRFNCERDDMDAALKGSTDIYWNYVRVPFENIGKVFPLDFSALQANIQSIRNDKGTVDRIFEDHVIRIIAAGYDYDKYYKSLFLFTQSTANDDIFQYNFYKVHSNVKNGTGIFAAYNQIAYRYKREK